MSHALLNTLYDPYVEGSDFVRALSYARGRSTVSSRLRLNTPDYDAPLRWSS
jgi:hypothetical protein